MTPNEQIASRMIVAANGQAVCLDKNSRFNCWVMYDNHGAWVSLRPALPTEIEAAKRQLATLEVFENIPCKG